MGGCGPDFHELNFFLTFSDQFFLDFLRSNYRPQKKKLSTLKSWKNRTISLETIFQNLEFFYSAHKKSVSGRKVFKFEHCILHHVNIHSLLAYNRLEYLMHLVTWVTMSLHFKHVIGFSFCLWSYHNIPKHDGWKQYQNDRNHKCMKSIQAFLCMCHERQNLILTFIKSMEKISF